MDKLLTIVVPVYNTEKYLRKCLDSLIVPDFLSQLEVLIVIDGSPDNSISIANEYAEKYPQTFIVVNKENGGHGSAINKGLELATGKYFRVLDSDDWFDSENFEKYLKILSREDSDIVMTHLVKDYVDVGQSIIWPVQGLTPDDYGKPLSDEVYDRLDFSFFMMARCSYKTEHLKQHNLKLLEKQSFDDTILHVFPLLFADKVTFYDISLYHYFLSRPDQSVKQKLSLKKCKDMEMVIKQMIDVYISKVSDLDEIKRNYFLKAIKIYVTNHFLMLNGLDYSDAKVEIRKFYEYIKGLPFYQEIRGAKVKCITLVPYRLFRVLYNVYAKFHKYVYS
ncbi:MAG: glycosyltransferase family 2 protein [Candidatus Limisoma sp.]